MRSDEPAIAYASLRERVLEEMLHAALDIAHCTNVECDRLHARCERLQAQLQALQAERRGRNGNGS